VAERALGNPKVEAVWNSAIKEYLTDDQNEMRAVTLAIWRPEQSGSWR